VDPGTGLTVLGTALGSKDLVVKILGPTAEYLGAGMGNWTEHGVRNLGRVFEKATKKLGDQIDRPGAVPPKVLKRILEDAPFCDDELGAEYFGGVLASSRSDVGRDDRGAAFSALVGRLSTYQIRSHFFLYKMVRGLYEGLTENLGMVEGRQRLKTFVPMSSYSVAMEFDNKENLVTILNHVMFGLSRESLIVGEFLFGKPEHLKSRYDGVDVPGILFSPSALGVELFLWAHGRGNLNVHQFLNPTILFNSDVEITITSVIRSVVFPDRTFPKIAQAATAVTDSARQIDEQSTS
jgi:hypothetical protein